MNEKTEKIKKIRNLLLAGGCVITAIICRHLPTNRESGWVAFFQLTRAYLYITLYCVWGISLQRRIVNKTARRCLCGIASLMVFWFVIRTLKYNVFYEPVLRRYSWYGYYVPLLSIPSLSVIAALKMRESENQKRRQWTGIFLVITVGVILLVMTNDLHQLVFRFPAEKPWTDDEYFYGPGFVLCVAWIAIGFLTMLGILIAKCRNPGKKKIWLPFVPLGLFFIWCIANIFRIPHLKIIAGDMAAACCLLIAALFESCIQCGLILVNNRYGELFQASRGINAQISDRNLNIRYTTGDGIELDKEEMKEFKKWLKNITERFTPDAIIGSGGNINKIHKLLNKKERERITYQELDILYEYMNTFNLEERERIMKLNSYRADVIIPAMKLFLTVGKICKINEIIVPKLGLSDGIIRLLYEEERKKQECIY